MSSTTPTPPKLALITGATGGIGQSTSHHLASLGYSLVLHYHANATKASTLVTALSTNYPNQRFQSFQADLSSYASTRSFHAAVVSTMGHPAVLFNNAGTTGGKSGVKNIEDVSIEDFETTWRTNCGSAFLLTQLCIPAMVERKWGRVIFCSSVAGFTGGIVGPHYASSKSALHGLIHWLSTTYSSTGVTINGIAPALIEDTVMLPTGGQSNSELAKKIPVGRLGRPEEIASTVGWMVGNGYVTNKVIAVDGGLYVQ